MNDRVHKHACARVQICARALKRGKCHTMHVYKCVCFMGELACKSDMYVSSECVHLIQSCVCVKCSGVHVLCVFCTCISVYPNSTQLANKASV